ncbi:MAG TPA: hypothetical protein VGO94_01630, partial [Mycobacteriales bacterium]|nr:hypothetical protein [Mycobacteriales bacterium]
VESMVAEWLAMPRQARRRAPSEEVVAVLAAGGQEVVQADDGTWYPREIPLPLYVTAPRAPERPAAPPATVPSDPGVAASGSVAAAGPVAAPAHETTAPGADDDDLPRAVNL